MSFLKRCMFVWINFLAMVKIGFIGWNMQLQHLANLVREMEGFRLTGWMNDGTSNQDMPDISDFVVYPSFEAFFRYVDAVAITYKSEETFETICHCLKHFKHVFLINAQCLKYKEVSYILKIAEESNVRFYPEFGSLVPNMNILSAEKSKDIQFIDINQTFSLNEGICVDGRLSLALLRNVCFIGGVVNANVKKVSANGWGFSEPGAGMLNAKIDFDNGSSANILLANSAKPRQIEIVAYGRSETLRINSIENIFKISRESLVMGQIECIEKISTQDSSLKYDMGEFLSAIFSDQYCLYNIENKHKSFRITHLIQEKINHFSSITIFYS